jgi:Matrixin
MRNGFLRFLYFIFGLSLLVLAGCSSPKRQDSCGFVQNVYGERVSWKGASQIRFYLHQQVPAEFELAFRKAAETWNRAIGKNLIFIDSQKVSTNAPARDGQNIIFYLNYWEAEKASEQARTSLYWVGDQIQEADIRINGHNYNFYGQTSVPGSVNMESLALHELGHVLGLKHNDSSPSVMATYLRTNQERSLLQESDEVSLNCEY